MHAGGSSFEMNTNLQPRQPQPSSIGGQDAPSLQRNESSRSILSMARDAVGSNLAEELGDSYQNLHDSSGSGWGDSRGGGGGSIAGKGGGGLGAALAQHKLKMQGSSNSSQDKDADAASTYSDFSTGRCYHDIAGKTNVLMEDKELYAKFQASLKEKGIRTGVGVKMALQEFVAENVSDADVARFEAAKRQKELAASGGGGQSISSSRSLRERVGSLGSLLHGSRQSLMGSSTSVGDPPSAIDDPGANASWNLSRSFDPGLANSGIKKSESFNNLIGDALGKFGLAAEGAGASAPPTDVVVGNSIKAGLRRMSGASTSSAVSQITTGDVSAQGTATTSSSHRQSQRSSTLSTTDAAAAVADMDLEGDYGDSSDEEGEVVEGDLQFDSLPPRAAERKRRASFGSLGALSMQKNFIDELSDEDDSSLSSSDDEDEVKPSSTTRRNNNHSNKTNGENRSRDDTQGLDSDEDSDSDDDKEYLGDELVVGFGPRPSRR